MSAYSDDGEEGFDYDSDAALDLDDDEADDDANALLEDEDNDVQEKAKIPSSHVAYESLSEQQLQQRIDKDIDRVASLTGCDPAIVKILLYQERWNVDRLIDKYMDSSDQTLRSAGEPANSVSITSPISPSSSTTLANPPLSPTAPRPSKRARRTVTPPPATFTCEICLDEPPPEEASHLRCGHSFCNTCWAGYLQSKIKDDGVCMAKCMSDGCSTIIDEPSLKRMVDPSIYDRWKALIAQSYVSARPSMRFCPAPSCTRTTLCASAAHASARLTSVPTVTCGEGHSFCAGCGLDNGGHAPLICVLAGTWMRSAREDAGTAQWIKANTRQCPKCQGVIEKGGGCNRMECRHCKYMFCWLCMHPWTKHGYNDSVCSTWTEPEATADMTDAKRNLERWLFYFDRFNNHELSAKLDEELLAGAEDRIHAAQDETGMSWIEAQYMRNAVEELSRTRLTLKWTYAMAHFLESGNDKHIFEDNQSDLEVAVEKLSQLLQEEIDPATIKELRQNTINKTVYVRQRHELIVEDTARRLQEGLWKWTVPVE